MPRKTKKAPKTKSNGITWTAARRKAHGAKIQAARTKAAIEYRHALSPWIKSPTVIAESSSPPDSTREAIRAKVRAILPGIIDEEIAALLER